MRPMWIGIHIGLAHPNTPNRLLNGKKPEQVVAGDQPGGASMLHHVIAQPMTDRIAVSYAPTHVRA
jgi:hypothetical protein